MEKTYNAKMKQIIENTLSRLDIKKAKEKDIFQAIYDELILTDDQWELVKFYCDIENASLNEAFEMFTLDMLKIVREMQKLGGEN